LEGCVLVVGIVLYIASNFGFLGKASSADEIEQINKNERSFAYLFFLIIFGLGLLVVGANFFQKGGIGIAKSLGVSEAVIGLTVLAFGTSLPELATSIVACMKKQGDLIAGNAIGSSVFNILAILGITIVAKPMPQVKGIDPTDLIFMVGSVFLVGALMMSKLKLGRCKGGAMIGLYVLYVILIVRRP
jgi:cation:H+ antiporter